MSSDFKELANDIDEHDKREAAKDSIKHVKSSMGHKPNFSIYIIIFLLVLLNISTILIFSYSLKDLRAEHGKTLSDLAAAKLEIDHYKVSYQIAMQDAQAFGKIYDINYKDRLANTTNATLNSVQQNNVIKQDDIKHLPKVDVMAYYLAQGIVNDSCIPTTKLVQTPDDVVELVVVASGKKDIEWPTISLIVDGTLISTFTLSTEEQNIFKTIVELPKGTHHIDLVYSNAKRSGDVTISLVRIGDRTIETETSILDYGAGFGLFDCKNINDGDTLTEDGAMRFRIEKV